MIKCTELNKEFETKELMFKALRDGVKDIISIKKARILESRNKGGEVKCKPVDISKVQGASKELFKDDNFYYIATNTTLVLDGHLDFHDNGIWNKTAKERTGKNYLVDTHVLSVSTTIARKENVEIFVASVPFSLLGKSYKGNTEALIYKIRKDKVTHAQAKEWLDSGDDIQASVCMQYVIIEFAMNSEEEEDAYFKKNYDDNINRIANKEDYEKEHGEIFYFWIVKEAKNTNEASLVLFGSNPVTGQVQIQVEPQKSTQTIIEAVKVDTSVNSLLI